MYEEKLTRGSSPLDDNGDDPFTAKRIVSLPPFVDNAFMTSRRESSHAPNQISAGLSGKQSELTLEMAPPSGDLRAIFSCDSNPFDLEAQRDGGLNDLDYSWME
jgi:hypothetical protein